MSFLKTKTFEVELEYVNENKLPYLSKTESTFTFLAFKGLKCEELTKDVIQKVIDAYELQYVVKAVGDCTREQFKVGFLRVYSKPHFDGFGVSGSSLSHCYIMTVPIVIGHKRRKIKKIKVPLLMAADNEIHDKIAFVNARFQILPNHAHIFDPIPITI